MTLTENDFRRIVREEIERGKRKSDGWRDANTEPGLPLCADKNTREVGCWLERDIIGMLVTRFYAISTQGEYREVSKQEAQKLVYGGENK